MFNEYQYNESLKRIITVFGALFNNIHISRKYGNKVSNTQRVPISYAPRKKIIARLESNTVVDKSIALVLPRMGFEITSIVYDSSSMLNKLNKIVSGNDSTGFTSMYQSVPYNIGITLSIYGNNQDDVYQIIEQILPIFTPQYTVSVKGLEGEGVITDVPFTISSVNLQDKYEGTFDTQRAIIHTIDFTAKGKFIGTPQDVSGIINEIDLRFFASLSDASPSEIIYIGDDGTWCDSPVYPNYSPSYSPPNSPSYSPPNSPSYSPSFSPSWSPSFSPSWSPSASPSMSPAIPDYFIAEVSIPSNGYSLTLPLYGATNTYDMFVDWGDGSGLSYIDDVSDPDKTHTYASSGTYTISITGICEYLTSYASATWRSTLTKIISLGDLGWNSFVFFADSCTNLTEFTSNVVSNGFTDCTNMFWGCTSLTSLDFTGFDSSNVTDMTNMFANCVFTTFDLTQLNTSSVTNMTLMFFNNTSITYLDLSNFDTSSATTVAGIFRYCSNMIVTIDDTKFWNRIPGWSSSSNYLHAFQGASSIVNYADIPADWKS